MPNLPINTGASAVQMANSIFGDGITVVSASYTGDSRSSGTYSNGDAVSGRPTPSDQGVILSTGRATDFTNGFGQVNQSTGTSTNTSGPSNNAQFNGLAGTNTYDASILDVDFIPTTDTISMQFTFASEEYPEYVNSIYNDIVGVWVNGSPAALSIGAGTTAINSINPLSNGNLFVNNTTDLFNTEMDGFTVTMTLKMTVIPNQVNSIRIGIADVGDSSYDSSLLIAGKSIQGNLIAVDDEFDIFLGGTKTIDVIANDTGPGASQLFITHINGIEVNAGDTITLNSGQQLTLNADGTLTVVSDLDVETVNFTYTVANGGGNGISDTAFVTLNSIPCFVSGTMILTPTVEVRVEDLVPGDLVMTYDEGPQPIRWIGRRRVPAIGDHAPISISAGALGQHRMLVVSPLHRVLVRDAMAELLFGESEVLVAARDLVNDSTIRRLEGGTVEYVHFLFDKHQVVFSEGLATESFLPGPQTTRSFEASIVEELKSIFPELDPLSGRGYSPAARRTLRRHEAQLLANLRPAA